MAKKAPPKTNSDGHNVQIEAYKSTFLNTTLYQPYCTCGWETPRWFTENQAKTAGKGHLAEMG